VDESAFWGCLLAVILWRFFSDLKPVRYEKIRGIVREELLLEEKRRFDLVKREEVNGKKKS
jgi:hypothetical protein